jgi:hypothetical protein
MSERERSQREREATTAVRPEGRGQDRREERAPSERERSQREREARTAVRPEGRGQDRREERAPSERVSERPVLRVVRGEPTEHELAALVSVLAARAAARASAVDTPAHPSAWGAPAARLRRPVYPGQGAWRRSALPG